MPMNRKKPECEEPFYRYANRLEGGIRIMKFIYFVLLLIFFYYSIYYYYLSSYYSTLLSWR